MSPRTVIAYARTSTGHQDAETQLVALRAYAARAGWQLTAELTEQASGSDSRPVLEGIERGARKGSCQVLLVAALDRLGRSVVDVISRLERLERAGCQVVSLREGIDLTTAAGRLQVQLLSAFAEFERALIGERTKQGLKRVRAQGTKLGRPRARVDAARVEELRASGASWAEIGRQLGCDPMTAMRRSKKGGSERPLESAEI